MQIDINLSGTKEELADVLSLLAGGSPLTTSEALDGAAKLLAEPPALPPVPATVGGGALPPVPAEGGALPPVTTGAADTPPDVELDGEFFPWDVRINTPTKTKLAKTPNPWKLIRGIETKSPGLVEQVKAELRTKGYGVPPVAGVTPPPAAGDVTTPPPPAETPTLDFPQIIAAINNKITAGELTDAGVDAGLAKLGIVGGPPMIGTKPELFPSVVRALGLC